VYSIFNQTTIHYGVRVLDNVRFIKERLKLDYDKYLEYIRDRDHVVPNNHILVRLLKTTLPSLDNDDFSFRSQAMINIKQTCRTFNIVSLWDVGKTTKDNIIFHLIDNPPFTEYKNYKEIEYLKYRYFPVIDFNYSQDLLPSIMGIDLLGLCIGYREWYYECIEKGVNYSPQEFIYKYVLPSTIPSKFALSLFNYLHSDAIPRPFDTPNGLAVIDPMKFYKHTKKRYNSNFHNRKIRIITPLFSIQSLNGYENMFDFIVNGDETQYYNRYNAFIYWIIYSHYLISLINLLGKESIVRNQQLKSEIKRGIYTLKQSRGIVNSDLNLKLLVKETERVLSDYIK
jgi:hypothetical protein